MAEPSQKAAGLAEPSVVSFKKRSLRSKGNIRKRPTPISSQLNDTSDNASSEDDLPQSHRIKRRLQNTGVVSAPSTNKPTTELFPTIFQADRNIPLTTTNDATKRSNWFDDENVKIGPTQASTNVRTTITTDFAPDVCKDFKTTGWCGFGDTCKFLHDRSDYKQGWQLDREWENVAKGKTNLGGTVVASANRNKAEDEEEDAEEAMLENIPFACVICTEAYKSPIITRCGHYFCEPCAIKRYRKDPTCAACGMNTNGVFNSASKLKKLLERKRERRAKKHQAAIEAGEEVSDEDG